MEQLAPKVLQVLQVPLDPRGEITLLKIPHVSINISTVLLVLLELPVLQVLQDPKAPLGRPGEIILLETFIDYLRINIFIVLLVLMGRQVLQALQVPLDRRGEIILLDYLPTYLLTSQ